MINDFKKFLEEEFPNMPDKVGRPKSKMPELTNLAIFRLLIHYTPDETISKIAGTYSQRRRISLKELEKAEKLSVVKCRDSVNLTKQDLLQSPWARLSLSLKSWDSLTAQAQ